MHTFEEQQLIQRVSQYRDHDAFQELYDRYAKRVFDLIKFKISRKEDVEDLTAQVFLRTWEYATSSDQQDIKNFRAFIYKVARNLVANFYREQGQTPPMIEVDDLDENLELSDDRTDAFIQQLSAQDIDYLIECVQKLPEPYKEVIALRFFEELSIHEIAEVMEKGAGNIKVLIHRGINKLRDIMLNNQKQYEPPRI